MRLVESGDCLVQEVANVDGRLGASAVRVAFDGLVIETGQGLWLKLGGDGLSVPCGGAAIGVELVSGVATPGRSRGSGSSTPAAHRSCSGRSAFGSVAAWASMRRRMPRRAAVHRVDAAVPVSSAPKRCCMLSALAHGALESTYISTGCANRNNRCSRRSDHTQRAPSDWPRRNVGQRSRAAGSAGANGARGHCRYPRCFESAVGNSRVSRGSRRGVDQHHLPFPARSVWGTRDTHRRDWPLRPSGFFDFWRHLQSV
jgi:hypothetical protein